jgi:hypothetical protein
VQSFSLATRQSDFAVLAGSTLGKESGPAGSLTNRFVQNRDLTLVANLIGADQEGDNPGPTNAPTPGAKKHSFRILPSILSQWKANADLTVQTTLYGDIQSLDSTDYDTHDRIRAFGVESAVLMNDTTFTFSARNVNFENNTAGVFNEWPAHGGITETFHLPGNAILRTTLSGDYLSGYAVYAGGRVSAEFPIGRKKRFFSELQGTPRFASIQDRLYVLPAAGYHGNPDLLPEKVFSLVAGYEDESSPLRTRTELKAEHRLEVIVPTPDFSTMMNSGSANFLSFSESMGTRITSIFRIQGQALATYSRVDDTGLPFPRLPSLSAGGQLAITPGETWEFHTQAKWMGESTESDGSALAGYLLLGEKITVRANEDWRIAGGVDNILDTHAEAIRHYPLPGRTFYASTEIRF